MHRLWGAVLLDALRLARRPTVQLWHRGANQDALAWLMDPSEDVQSCRWVLSILPYDWIGWDDVRRWAASRKAVPRKWCPPSRQVA